METIPEDTAMQRTHKAVATVGGVLSVVALSFFGGKVGVGVFAGAVVASLNLLVLSRTVRNVVDGGQASWAAIAVLKFLTLMAVTYGLLKNHLVDPMGLAFGFGALPFGIVLAGTFSSSPHADVPSGTTHPSAVSGRRTVESDHA
jgi:hypothetical protein